jgi:hypothetical protein
MLEAYETRKEREHEFEVDQQIAELAQKLFNEDGYSGNIYKQEPEICMTYEDKVWEIIKNC